MARIAGINLPKGKRIEIALIYIKGIGRSKSRKILKELNIDLNTKVEALTEEEISKLRDKVTKIPIEGELRRKTSLNIKRLQEIGSYRGFRHRKKLPARGQRTRTNARTKKGKKKTIANKKIVTK